MPFDAAHFAIVSEEISRHLEDTETSKLGHWEAARRYDMIHRLCLGLPATLLSILLSWVLSSDTVAALPGTSLKFPVLLSLMVSMLTGLNAFLSFNTLASQHRAAAEKLNALWRECKNWRTDYPDASNCEKAVKTVQAYRSRLSDINGEAPQIPKWAWKSVEKQKDEGSVTYDDIPELSSPAPSPG